MKKIIDIDKIFFDDNEKKYYSDVYLEKVVVNSDNTSYNFFITSNEILPNKYVEKLNEKIKTSVFNNNDINLNVKIKYNLFDKYSFIDIFNLDKDNIFFEIAKKDKISSTIFRNATYNYDEQENILIIKYPFDNSIKKYVDTLVIYLENLFKERYDRDITVKLIDDEQKKDDFYKRIDEIEKNLEKKMPKNSEDKVDELLGYVKSDKKNGERRYKNYFYDDINVYGKILKNDNATINISDINTEESNVTVSGVIFSSNIKKYEENNAISYNFNITDGKDSIICNMYIKNVKDIDLFYDIINKRLQCGTKVLVNGNIKFNNRFKQLVIEYIQGIKIIGFNPCIEIIKKEESESYNILVTEREDTEINKRIELHAHTKFSANDGVGAIEDYIEAAIKFKMPAIAITDHGCVQALANAYHYLLNEKYNKKRDINLKIINGVEGYLIDDDIFPYVNLELKKTDANFNIENKHVVFDILTNGDNVKSDSIVIISAKKVEASKVIDEFFYFINIKKPLSFDFREKYNISEIDKKNAVEEEFAIKRFCEFIKDADDLMCFDIKKNSKFLLRTLKKYDCELNCNLLDLSIIAKNIYKDIKKIDIKSIYKYTGVGKGNVNDIRYRIEVLTNLYKNFYFDTKEKYTDSEIEKINDLYKVNDEYLKRMHPYHIILLAKNDVGRVNLYKIISDSYIDCCYNDRPRIKRSNLIKYREGIIVGSACIMGEFMNAIVNGASEVELLDIASFYDYLEIQPVGNNSFLLNSNKNFNNVNDLIELNKKVIEIGKKLEIPVVATCDSHYVDKEDKLYRTMLRHGIDHQKKNIDEKTGKVKNDTLNNDENFGEEELYFRTTDEMLREFSYLGDKLAYEVVVTNTNLINDMIEDFVYPVRLDKASPKIDNSDEDLKNACMKEFYRRYGENAPKEFLDRMNNELKMIIDNGYSGLYITAKKLIDDSLENGYIVGSRGSVGSSIVANLIGVSEVNPYPVHYICEKCKHIEYKDLSEYANMTGFDMPEKNCPICGTPMKKDGVNIPFETFLGMIGGKPKEPDIDLNFSSKYQNTAHKYAKEMFGESHAIKAGTISTIASKTAYGYVMNYLSSNKLEKRPVEIEREKLGITDVKKTTGQHPGGIVVVPKDEYIYTFTPIHYPSNNPEKGITTHFEYHKIENNLLKLDMLGHSVPDFIKKLHELTGVNPMTVPFYEKEVIELFKSTNSINIKSSDIHGTKLGCLSIPEFGTNLAMSILEDAKIENIADLIRVSGLSHGTDVWLGNARDLILNNTTKLEGCICCRDDIMLYLIEKGIEGSIAFNIMEKVRKGKVLSKDDEKIMREAGIPEWYIDSCNKIKYLFPKAHAAAYVTNALKIGYFKVHYPIEYYAAFLSIQGSNNTSYEIMCTDIETLRMNIKKYIDVKDNEDSESNKEEKTSLRTVIFVVEEMLARGIKWEKLDINVAKPTDFIIVNGKIMPSLSSIDGISDKSANILYEEAKKEKFKSIDDLKKRGHLNNTIIESMKRMGILESMKESDKTTIIDLLSQ